MEIYIVSLSLISFLSYLSACFFKPGFFSRIAIFSLLLGFLGNLYLIIQHFINTERLPLTNTSETLLSVATLIVFIFLMLAFKRHDLNEIGVLVSLISSIGLIASFWLLKKPLVPLLPALQSKLLVFHVSSCIVAYCFFTVSFITALIYLIREKSDQRVLLTRFTHRFVCLGFYFLTLGIILGSIWGKSAWGHWWNWDPKETWALITWLIYAAFIHGRLFGSWSEEKLAGIAIVGFSACLFTYLGVNFLLKGLHSYA